MTASDKVIAGWFRGQPKALGSEKPAANASNEQITGWFRGTPLAIGGEQPKVTASNAEIAGWFRGQPMAKSGGAAAAADSQSLQAEYDAALSMWKCAGTEQDSVAARSRVQAASRALEAEATAAKNAEIIGWFTGQPKITASDKEIVGWFRKKLQS